MTTAIDAGLRTRRAEIVNRHVQAENDHDPAGVVATFADPRYDVDPLGPAGQVSGGDGVKELWEGLIAGFPDIHITPGPLMHADEAVFVEVRMTGTQLGDWGGIPATGKAIDIRVACLFDFEGDRLVCERIYFDFATVLRQLGLLS